MEVSSSFGSPKANLIVCERSTVVDEPWNQEVMGLSAAVPCGKHQLPLKHGSLVTLTVLGMEATWELLVLLAWVRKLLLLWSRIEGFYARPPAAGIMHWCLF